MPKFWGRQRPRRLIYAVGLYTVGVQVYDMLYPALSQTFREKLDLSQRYGKGTWVVVSGSTNEIGREFVRQFNGKGFNLLIVDSNEEELKVQAEMTREKSLYSDVQVVPITFDFKGSNKWQDYEELHKKIAEITKEQ